MNKMILADLCRACSKEPSIFKIGFDSAVAGYDAAFSAEASSVASERSFEF